MSIATLFLTLLPTGANTNSAVVPKLNNPFLTDPELDPRVLQGDAGYCAGPRPGTVAVLGEAEAHSAAPF